MSLTTGFMTNSVMNSAKPVVISAGGRSCIDIARLRNDSTTTMRVKHVIVMTIAGAIASSVISSTISSAEPSDLPPEPVWYDSVSPPPWPCGAGKALAAACAPTSGLPMGGDLEYADEVTLGRALAGRSEM